MNVDRTKQKAGPLSGIRVLDLSRLVAGNMLTLQLADFGAEVIKIEEPRRGDTLRPLARTTVCRFIGRSIHGNKRAWRSTIRTPDGGTAFLRWQRVRRISFESNRPGVLERLGIGPDSFVVQESRPDRGALVRVGTDGTIQWPAGFGSLVEALSGFAAKNGFADKPHALPNLALARMVAGLYGAYASMVALREVESKGGQGQIISTVAVWSLCSPFLLRMWRCSRRPENTAEVRQSRVDHGARNVYLTSDGQWFALSASTKTWPSGFSKAMGHAELISDPTF